MILRQRLRLTMAACAAVCIAVQLDWLLGTGLIPAMSPGSPTMKFPTASMMLVVAIGLWQGQTLTPRMMIARGCGGLVATVALGYLTAAIAPAHVLLLSPSPATAMICLLLGLNLLLRERPLPLLDYAAAAAAVVAALIAFSGLLGHIIGTEHLVRIQAFQSMAVPTSLTGLALAGGALIGDPNLPAGTLLRDRGSAGTITRQLLPAILLLMVLVAVVLRFSARSPSHSWLIDIALLLALLTVLAVITLIVLGARLHSTERAEAAAREASRASETFADRVLAAVPAAILVVDDAGVIVRSNAQADTMFATAHHALVGRNIETLVPPRQRDLHAVHRSEYQGAPSARAMGRGRDLSALRDDGSVFPVSVGLNPVTIGERRYVIASVVDLSERKAAEHALQRYATDLERSNAELERFAFIASHDLEEPLRAIRGFSGRLVQEYAATFDERGRRWLAQVDDSAQRMTALIHDLLLYSRVRSSELKLTEIDVEAALATIAIDLGPLIEECGARIRHDPLPRVAGDPIQFAQLLRNLISNAIHYRAERPLQLSVSCRKVGAEWEFAVTDNGIGIEPVHFERVFEVFKRLHSRRAHAGTGVGLAICRAVVERHGGRIWVESTPGQGSSFFFTLPATDPRMHVQPSPSAH